MPADLVSQLEEGARISARITAEWEASREGEELSLALGFPGLTRKVFYCQVCDKTWGGGDGSPLQSELHFPRSKITSVLIKSGI